MFITFICVFKAYSIALKKLVEDLTSLHADIEIDSGIDLTNLSKLSAPDNKTTGTKRSSGSIIKSGQIVGRKKSMIEGGGRRKHTGFGFEGSF